MAVGDIHGLKITDIPAPAKKRPRERIAMSGVDNKFLEDQTIKELSKLMAAQDPSEEAKRLKRLVNIDMRKEQLGR